MGLTSDPNDPRVVRGSHDTEPTPQHEVYLVLSDEERAKGFVRPLRTAYRHNACGSVTTMGLAIAETYARQPTFYGATYCVHCSKHLPVGADGEFVWIEQDGSDGPKVGHVSAIDLTAVFPPGPINPDSDIARLCAARGWAPDPTRRRVLGTRRLAGEIAERLPRGDVVLDCTHVHVMTTPFLHELLTRRPNLTFDAMNEDVAAVWELVREELDDA